MYMTKPCLDVSPKILRFAVGKSVKLQKGDIVKFHISKVQQFAQTKCKAVSVKRHDAVYLKYLMLNEVLNTVNYELEKLAIVESKPCEAIESRKNRTINFLLMPLCTTGLRGAIG